MPRVTRSLQPYFKHDGSVKATGDFDLDIYKLLFEHMLLKSSAGGEGYLDLRNLTDTAYARLRCSGIFNYGNYVFGNNAILAPMAPWIPQNYYIQAVDGSVYVTVATIESSANPHITLNHAGDINLLGGAVISIPSTAGIASTGIIYNFGLTNLSDGTLRLPIARSAVPVRNDCRYDAASDTFEIYDGAVWRAH